jgi:hypothetical protein
MDIVDLVESDDRVQFIFTVAPDVFNADVPAHLQRLGALVIPWQQAIHEKFDLAVAAAHGGLHELHAPVMLLAHGAGRARLIRPSTGGRHTPAEAMVYGLDAPRLIRDGRVIASALVLSHENERDVLARQCPDALPAAVLAGDPCFDRLTDSLGMRPFYRRALGLTDRRRLVVVSSTWGRDGLFGGAPELLPSLMAQLPPDQFRVALLLHPAILGAHGHRQVGAWIRPCRDAGMIFADPSDDWRAYVAAADYLIGDRGSVTTYGAAVGLPVLCVPGCDASETAGASPQSVVLAAASRLDLARPLLPQVTAAQPVDHRPVVDALTSRPGRSGVLLSKTVYHLLGLPKRRAGWALVPAPGCA